MIGSQPRSRRPAYARVSTYGTYGQTLDAQLEQLRAEGCARIYRERASGARPDRRELLKLLKPLAPGDVVAVTRIDRLARSPFDLFAMSRASWARADSFDHWRSHGPTRPLAPGA